MLFEETRVIVVLVFASGNILLLLECKLSTFICTLFLVYPLHVKQTQSNSTTWALLVGFTTHVNSYTAIYVVCTNFLERSQKH